MVPPAHAQGVFDVAFLATPSPNRTGVFYKGRKVLTQPSTPHANYVTVVSWQVA
jgi:hypothetical protein